MPDEETPTPKPALRPAPPRETVKRGYQPIRPLDGHQPNIRQDAPSNPPSRGSGGKNRILRS